MTRIAVISDVHANLHALRAVLESLERTHVDSLLCAGDIVGYGAHPNECIEILSDMGMVSVAGNHDLVALGLADPGRCDELARKTLEWTAGRLSEDSRRYLSQLPTSLCTGPVAVTHGSFTDVFEYVRTAEQAGEQLAELSRSFPSAHVLVLGHTHQPWAFTGIDGAIMPAGRQTHLRLVSGQRYLLNPGSVGQSRDRSPDASYLLLDLGAREAVFHRVKYDVAACREDLRRHGLPPESCHRQPDFAATPRRAVGGILRRLGMRRAKR